MPRILLVAVTLALLLSPPTSAQTPYTDKDRHFRATLPAGWTFMPAALVKQLETEALRRTGGAATFRYIAGCAPAPADQVGMPYVLVQETPMPMQGAGYEDIERALGAEAKSAQGELATALKDVASNLKVGTPTLDRTHNRMYVTMNADLPNAGAMKALSVGFLGKDGIIQFNCYTTAARFESDLPAFQSLIDSFVYDPGHDFEPAPSPLARIATYAAIGAAIGALGGLFQWFRKRKPA